MIKFIKTVTPSPEQWQIAIEGMVLPYGKTNIGKIIEKPCISGYDGFCQCREREFVLTKQDLVKAHNRMLTGWMSWLPVSAHIDASLLWWLEFEDLWVFATANKPLPFKPFVDDSYSTRHSASRIDKIMYTQMVFFNYQDLRNIYLKISKQIYADDIIDDWNAFKAWIYSLPYSELITGDFTNEHKPTNIPKDILRDIENSYRLDITGGTDVSAD